MESEQAPKGSIFVRHWNICPVFTVFIGFIFEYLCTVVSLSCIMWCEYFTWFWLCVK